MYHTLVVDPPWPGMKAGPLRGRGGFLDATGASRDMPYGLMSEEDLMVFPIDKWAAPDSHLYLWTTNKHLPMAFALLEDWGYTYSTTIVWAKNPMGGGLGGAWGISTEYVLFGRRGKLPATGRVTGTWFNWKRPYDERGKPRHSAKPNAFYETVMQVSPGPYIELFARDPRPGWDGWGDQYPEVQLVSD